MNDEPEIPAPEALRRLLDSPPVWLQSRGIDLALVHPLLEEYEQLKINGRHALSYTAGEVASHLRSAAAALKAATRNAMQGKRRLPRIRRKWVTYGLSLLLLLLIIHRILLGSWDPRVLGRKSYEGFVIRSNSQDWGILRKDLSVDYLFV